MAHLTGRATLDARLAALPVRLRLVYWFAGSVARWTVMMISLVFYYNS